MPRRGQRERQLLRRIAAGDEQAFSLFYREHLDAVIAYFARRVPDPEQAFDLAAETFAAVVVSAARYDARDEAPPVAWLFGIAANKLRESLRRGRIEAAARERLGIEPMRLGDAEIERVDERASAGGPQLERLLDELPAATRDVLLARVVDEQDYEQIAARMHCSPQVARQRVSRGLAALRAGWENDEEETG